MELSHLLWSPTDEFKQNSNLYAYMQWLQRNKNLSFKDYKDLWQWSVIQTEDFWKSLFEYFNILHDGHTLPVSDQEPMPGTSWFPNVELNYAEHIFRKENTAPAIIFQSEKTSSRKISWAELKSGTASLQQLLIAQGVNVGDRVAGYLPCIPEATIGLLATTSLGAIWTSCSPDFGTQAVVDRFAQVEPKVLIAVDAYTYGGKTFDKTEVIDTLIRVMPSLKCVVLISEKESIIESEKIFRWRDLRSDNVPLKFVRVPFSHPLWILYSSGTTGLPKAIMHSQGGILLEHLKYGAFHNDYKPGERCFWYTTTGWMMWNYIHGSLLAGATMVLYDGSPTYPNLEVLWKFTQDHSINHFGTSAGFILANQKAETSSNQYDLKSLRSIGSTGSTLPVEGFNWVYKHIKSDVWLTSMSGGTDVCSAFVGGNPLWPVYAGEIQCRALGCSLEAFNEDGKSVVDEVGEMVITKPMPSMPVRFWNDPEFKRYTESYFEMFPGIWRHGDWTRITPRHGVIIYGRSDATLNRGGIRIGTSEIYRAVDKVEEVKDSMIICIEKSGGEFWMPLFVVLKEGVELNDALTKKINSVIRSENSPRHVPDEIILVPDLPYTVSGKKTETPVKKILMGKDPKQVVNDGSLRNPESMNFFIQFAKA
jgi:acetoacetyl-CoA synthetase